MSGAARPGVEAWADAAAGWERQRAQLASVGAPVTTRLLELLAPGREETILELACGNGEVGLEVAAAMDGGVLIQSDVAAEMVAAARREAGRRGLTAIDHRVLDAERLDLEDGSVDGVVCRWGYMLLPDPGRGLAETRRVLRPGGRVALAVWAEAEHNPWATASGRTLLQLGLVEPPDPDAPGPFRLGDRELLLAVVRGAGLDVEAEEAVAISWRAPTFAAFWEATLDLSNTLRELVGRLAAERLEEVRSRVEETVSAYADGDGIALPGLCRVVLARAPG